MTWLALVVGAAAIAAVLHDIFHTLWHPSGQGNLSRLVMATVWRLATRTWFRGWLSPLAGPLCMVAVIGTWASLLVAGWAAIYWPHLPQGFVYSTGLQPTGRAGLLDAIYLSLVAMSTLGLGDIVPTQGWPGSPCRSKRLPDSSC